MRKNLDLTTDCIKAITIEAVEEGTVFKLHAEKILENHAKNLIAFKKQKSGGEKQIKKWLTTTVD